MATKAIRKLKPPLVMDQAKGEIKSGPHTNNEEKDLICQINKASILADTKMEIMQ